MLNQGCNNFFGSYEMKEGNQISLSKLGRTQKFCQDDLGFMIHPFQS